MSKEEKQKLEQKKAKNGWQTALSANDQSAMEMAALDLSIAELYDEYVDALKLMVERFPDRAFNYENDLGVHYYFQEDFDAALQHYIYSYNLDEAGGCAESNILEVCQKMADETEDAKASVRYLMRYFRICTRKVDPSATVEDIDLLSVLSSRARPLTDVRAEEAESALDDVRDRLDEVEDGAFVAEISKELDQISNELHA